MIKEGRKERKERRESRKYKQEIGTQIRWKDNKEGRKEER